MTAFLQAAANEPVGEELLVEFYAAVHADLSLLAALNGAELSHESIQELREMGFPKSLGLRLDSEQGLQVLAHLDSEISGWPLKLDQQLLDKLAVDYAAIYLNNTCSTSPQESYWLDEENLVMQKPMFQVREWYQKRGVKVPEWRVMPDDHLVNQLQFVAEIFREKVEISGLQDAARFLDEHLLRWVDQFAERAAIRSGSDFYGGLALLTWLYCESLRDLLAELLEEARPSREEIEERMSEAPEVIPVPMQFIPGAKPSW